MAIYLTNTDTNDQISKRTHKAKKNHTCVSCQSPIPKGTVYTKTVFTFDGYFASNTWHTECQESHEGYVKDQQRKQ